MSGAIRTMTNAMAGQMTTDASRACGRSITGTDAYVWSTGNATRIAAIAPIPVFADTKLHARRPKEASQ
jgi:hypothetical protein